MDCNVVLIDPKYIYPLFGNLVQVCNVEPEDSCAEEEEEAKESETTVRCDVEPEDSCGEEEEAKQSETTATCDIVKPEDSCAEEEEAKQSETPATCDVEPEDSARKLSKDFNQRITESVFCREKKKQSVFCREFYS